MSLPNRKLSLALLLSLLLATTSISTAFNGPKGVGVGGSQAHRMTKKCKTKKLKKKKEKGESEGGPLPKDPKKASKEGEPEAAPKKESKTPEPKEPASKGPKGSPPAPKDDTPSAPKSDDAPKKRRRRRVETKKTPGPKEGTPPKDDKSKKSPKSAPKEDTEIAEDEWECTEWHLQEMKSSCSAVVEEMEDDDTDDSTAVALEQKVIVVPFSYTLTTRTGTVTDAEIEYMEEAIHDTIVKRQLKCEVQQRMVRRKLQQPEPDAPADVVVVGADPAPRDEPSTEQASCSTKGQNCVVMDGFVTLLVETPKSEAQDNSESTTPSTIETEIVVVQSTQDIIRTAMDNGDYDKDDDADGNFSENSDSSALKATYLDGDTTDDDTSTTSTADEDREISDGDSTEVDSPPAAASDNNAAATNNDDKGPNLAPLAVFSVLIIGAAYWFYKSSDNKTASSDKSATSGNASVTTDGDRSSNAGSAEVPYATAEIVLGSSRDESAFPDSDYVYKSARVLAIEDQGDDVDAKLKKKKADE